MELTCTATPACLARIRTEVKTELRDRLAGRALDEVSLAVGEACANVVAHAYEGLAPGPLRVRLEVVGDELRVTLGDRGRPVEPGLFKGRDLDDVRPGGLGLHFIQCAFDPIEFGRDGDGWNRLTLVRKLPPRDG